MNKKSTKDNSKYLVTQGWASIIINLFLFVIKYAAGISSHSLALIADAWHTLSDSISSIIVLISAKIAKKPADREHPFGHGRVDLIASLIIGVILGIIGFNFLWEGVQRLISQERIAYKSSAIVVTIISILCKEGLAQYAFWAKKKTGFETLYADGWHHRSDAISSGVLLIGILFSDLFWWIDSVLSIIISVLIFQATYEIMKRAINPLIGEQVNDRIKKDINKICQMVHKEELHPHHFHIHRYGSHTELTFHIMLDGNMDVARAHDISEKIEIEVKKKLGFEATIHYDPFDEDIIESLPL